MVTVFSILRPCIHSQVREIVKSAIPPFLALILITLVLISCWKYQWFYTNSGLNYPYKTVYKVINFARKNKYPLHHSALTYGDDYIPSRLDFAKERFGGPFTTEQVKNVKTFLRILFVLFSIGPVLVLEVAAFSHCLAFMSYITMIIL